MPRQRSQRRGWEEVCYRLGGCSPVLLLICSNCLEICIYAGFSALDLLEIEVTIKQTLEAPGVTPDLLNSVINY